VSRCEHAVCLVVNQISISTTLLCAQPASAIERSSRAPLVFPAMLRSQRSGRFLGSRFDDRNDLKLALLSRIGNCDTNLNYVCVPRLRSRSSLGFPNPVGGRRMS
jgi:hypothetical protein